VQLVPWPLVNCALIDELIQPGFTTVLHQPINQGEHTQIARAVS
jgi:hypothetical protein